MKPPFTLHNLFLLRGARKLFFLFQLLSQTLPLQGCFAFIQKFSKFQNGRYQLKHFLRKYIECPKSEPFNKHSGSKIDKSNGTKISGKNCLKFGYTLYARLSFSSDRNSRKMFHSGAVDGKALFYSPLKIFEYSSRESVVVRLSILGFRNSSFFM